MAYISKAQLLPFRGLAMSIASEYVTPKLSKMFSETVTPLLRRGVILRCFMF